MTPVLLTINGTGDPAPWDTVGFSGMLGSWVGTVNPWAVVANQLGGLSTSPPSWTWQGIGYPASVFPMNSSVQNAREQVVAALGGPPSPDYAGPVYTGPFALSGYSQGAIVTDTVWTQDILAADGVVHHRLADCLSVVNFGDPWRCPGVANGNTYQGISIPGNLDGVVTGGIGGSLDLTGAQTNYPNVLGNPTVMSYALPGDLYASAPTGPNPWSSEAAAGTVGTSFYNIVLNGTFLSFIEIAKDLFHPVGDIEEAGNAIGFFAAGTNAAHWQYGNAGCVSSATQYLINLAASL